MYHLVFETFHKADYPGPAILIRSEALFESSLPLNRNNLVWWVYCCTWTLSLQNEKHRLFGKVNISE